MIIIIAIIWLKAGPLLSYLVPTFAQKQSWEVIPWAPNGKSWSFLIASSNFSSFYTTVLFRSHFVCNAMPILTLQKSNFKDRIWTSVIKESIWTVIDSHLHPNNILLIGTQLVIHPVSLWSAVQYASSTLRWNYSAITHMELILTVIAQRKPHYPAICASKTNIQPFLPLVAHLKSNLKYHRGQSYVLKSREANREFTQDLRDS